MSSSRACSRSPSSSCSASTCSASRGSSGTSAPASSGLQGAGSLGAEHPSVSRPPCSSSLTCVAPERTVRCSSRRYPQRPSATAADSPGPSAGKGVRGNSGGGRRGAVDRGGTRGRGQRWKVNGGTQRLQAEQWGWRKGGMGGGGRQEVEGQHQRTVLHIDHSLRAPICFSQPPSLLSHFLNPWGPRQA